MPRLKIKLPASFTALNKLWIYTFTALLCKLVIFLGFILNKTHAQPQLIHAVKLVFDSVGFRPVFYIGFIVLFLSVAFLLQNQQRQWYLISFNLAVSLILLFDLWYLRSYNTMTTLDLFRQISNLTNLSGSIVSLINLNDAIFIIDIIFLVAYRLLFKDSRREKPRNVFIACILLAVSLGSLVLIIPYWQHFKDPHRKQTIINQYDAVETSVNLSPIGYHVYNAYRFWKDTQPVDLTTAEKDQIKTWYDQKEAPQPDNKYKALFKGQNLIILHVESLENFVINQSYQGQEITPVMNKLLNNSLYFSNIYAQVNCGMSSDAELITNTSIYPVRNGNTYFSYPYTTYNSLPGMLKDEGYSTIAFHNEQGSYGNWIAVLSFMGFETCIDSTKLVQNECFGFGLSDGSYLKQVGAITARQKQPFYEYTATMSSHMPFYLPAKFRELKLPTSLDQSYLGGYLQCIRYTDKCIGDFLTTLEQEKLLDNTVIVIYGDHEGVHRFYPDDVRNARPSEDWWMNNHGQIPLIIYHKNLKGRILPVTGGQIDTMPTLCYLLGIDEKLYARTAMGRNLLTTKQNFAVLSDMNLIDGKTLTQPQKGHVANGLLTADLIIRSNYFKQPDK